MKISEKIIVNKLIKKEYDAFESFYFRYVNLVHFVIAIYINNKELGDELTKKVFTDILEKIVLSYSSKLTLKTWIAIQAKDYCLKYLKENQNNTKNNETTELVLPTEPCYKALEIDLKTSLKPLEYQVLFLKLVAKMSYKEMTPFLEIPILEIKNTYKEVIKKIYLANKK